MKAERLRRKPHWDFILIYFFLLPGIWVATVAGMWFIGIWIGRLFGSLVQ